MRSSGLLALFAVTASVGLTAVAPPAIAAPDSAVSLPLTAFRDLVVDDAHGHVFLSGGGSNGIVVRDLEGLAVTTITNQPGAAQLALSADGSLLYAALSGGDAVSAIDTATLAETARYPTGPGTCPSTVAVTSAKVWFGYGCNGAQGNLGVIDPAAPTPTAALTQLPAGTFYNAPGLQASAGKPGVLVAGEFGQSPGHLQLIDVSSGTAVLGATRDPGGNLRDWAVSSDGSRVVTASGAPYYHQAFTTTDLSADGVYGTNNPYPNAVATGTGGFVAAGIDASYAPDIVIYRADGSSVRSYEMGGCCSQGQSGSLAPSGLAFSADTSRLYAVTTDYLGAAVHLRVLHDASKTASSIRLTKPASAAIKRAFTISGSLTSSLAIPAGALVSIQRDSTYGRVNLPARTTSSTGAFAFSDTVTKRGSYGYTASWPGDASHQASSTRIVIGVTGLATTLAITTPSGPYSYGQRPVIVAHLGTTRVRTVSLYATPHGRPRQLLRTGAVDASGNLRVAYTMTRRTLFTAVFNGDDTYNPISANRVLTSRVRLTSSLSGSYATSGSYKLFHSTVDPVVPVTVAPNQAGACVSFVAQRYYSGAWHTAATLNCLALNSQSQAVARFYGSHPIGGTYRMQATFNGTASNVRTVGPYLYLKFTR